MKCFVLLPFMLIVQKIVKRNEAFGERLGGHRVEINR